MGIDIITLFPELAKLREKPDHSPANAARLLTAQKNYTP